jgi:hypothetical protein
MNHVRATNMAMSDRFAAGFLVVITIFAGLAGCGRKDDAGKAEAPKAPAARPAPDDGQGNGAAAAKDERRMANAVTTGKAGAALDLQYELAPKPMVGAPFIIDLSFIPRVTADSLEVQLSATPGLRITSAETVRFDSVQAGERYAAQATVIGDTAGLYYVGVIVRMATKVQTDARTFSIPVAVGEIPAAEKPAPKLDAEGKPIAPLPAAESAGT